MIVLASPIDTGDLCDNYTHAKVINFAYNALFDSDNKYTETIAAATWSYGWKDNGVFVKGPYQEDKGFELRGEDMTDVFGTLGNASETLVDHDARALYEWMVANIAALAGSTVEESLP